MNYYNEIDDYAARWLQNLMDAGHIAPGYIDTRSIEDVSADDLRGFTQCHFFAGIGGWPLALALAGWPSSEPVWTGSCPCQPFSAAGKGAGFADQRHLWPALFHLIRECRPPTIFGEQVASKAVDTWIDLVHADVEGVGYAFGSVPFPAAGVGAPHIRDRNYWVAYALGQRFRSEGLRSDESAAGRVQGENGKRERLWPDAGTGCNAMADGLADPDCGERSGFAVVRWDERDRANARRAKSISGVTARGEDGWEQSGPVNGLWRDADWLACRDGKWRPVEPGTFPLAHGIPGRVGRLRAYGNAIVPQAAAEFIRAYIEASGVITSEVRMAA